jgi:DNA-binding MarR family transcriptional regulator
MWLQPQLYTLVIAGATTLDERGYDVGSRHMRVGTGNMEHIAVDLGSAHEGAVGDERGGAVSMAAASPAGGGERSLEPGELRAWRAFLEAHAVVTRRLEAELAAQANLPLAHYDVLVQLAFAPEGRLRMHELAERVLLSRSGVTRLVDRLESEGLVRRATCASDARGAFASLTDAGLARLRDATPVHLDGVRRHFADLLRPAELDQLATLLERLAAGGRLEASGPDRVAERID